MVEVIKKFFACEMVEIKMYKYKFEITVDEGEYEIEYDSFTNKTALTVLQHRLYSSCGCYMDIDNKRYYRNQIKNVKFEILETKTLYVFDKPIENMFYKTMSCEDIDSNNIKLKKISMKL